MAQVYFTNLNRRVSFSHLVDRHSFNHFKHLIHYNRPRSSGRADRYLLPKWVFDFCLIKKFSFLWKERFFKKKKSFCVLCFLVVFIFLLDTEVFSNICKSLCVFEEGDFFLTFCVFWTFLSSFFFFFFSPLNAGSRLCSDFSSNDCCNFPRQLSWWTDLSCMQVNSLLDAYGESGGQAGRKPGARAPLRLREEQEQQQEHSSNS